LYPTATPATSSASLLSDEYSGFEEDETGDEDGEFRACCCCGLEKTRTTCPQINVVKTNWTKRPFEVVLGNMVLIIFETN
jgi:hypothetical protein